MKILKKILIFAMIILVLWILLFVVLDIKTIILQKIYPKKYTEYVEKYAQEYKVDSLLIYSIIKIESDFNPNAKSHSEAIGLMQLMEKTAKEVSNKIDQEVTVKQMYEPEKNIQIGIKYFTTLVTHYDENTYLALAAYNAGMGNVNEWLQKGIIKKDGSDIENIPYKETNQYVRKVMNAYQIYQEIY